MESTRVDWVELRKQLGDDPELLGEILGLFLEHIDAQWNGLEQAVADLDPVAIESSAHKLKGSVAQVAAASTRDLAYALEELGRSGEVDEEAAAVLLDQIGTALTEVKLEIESGLSRLAT